MRDTFNNNSVIQLISSIEALEPEIWDEITKVSDKEEKREMYEFLFASKMKKTIAYYSIGNEKEIIKNSLFEAIEAFENGFEWLGFRNHHGGYDKMLWLLSIAVLCDIEEENFRRITSILERDGANDHLLTEIIQYKQQDWETSNAPVIQEHPYASVSDIQNADEVQNYLDNVWYQGHSDAYWHDIHKNEDVNNYFGYWAWEVAALVKIRGIDDSNLKNQKYYPYDAVHWDEITPFGVIGKPI